jgi:hypothetical protein
LPMSRSRQAMRKLRETAALGNSPDSATARVLTPESVQAGDKAARAQGGVRLFYAQCACRAPARTGALPSPLRRTGFGGNPIGVPCSHPLISPGKAITALRSCWLGRCTGNPKSCSHRCTVRTPRPRYVEMSFQP